MRHSLVCTLSLIAAVAAVSPASAQRRRPQGQPRARTESAITINRGSIAIEPFAGYLITPSYFNGPINTTLGTSGAPMYGASLSLPLAPSASIIGTAAYSSGNLRVGIPLLGGYNFGTANTWVFDASVELRADNMKRNGARIIPFAQLGGGALRRTVGVSGFNAHTTDFTVSGGVGFNIPLSASSDIQVLAKDYYGKADFGSVGSFDVSTKDIHTIGLTGGLRISF
jgi:hypothetical protein